MWFRIDLHCLNNHIKHPSDKNNVITLERTEIGKIKRTIGKILENFEKYFDVG